MTNGVGQEGRPPSAAKLQAAQELYGLRCARNAGVLEQHKF